jgi:hypothetical protein
VLTEEEADKVLREACYNFVGEMLEASVDEGDEWSKDMMVRRTAKEREREEKQKMEREKAEGQAPMGKEGNGGDGTGTGTGPSAGMGSGPGQGEDVQSRLGKRKREDGDGDGNGSGKRKAGSFDGDKPHIQAVVGEGEANGSAGDPSMPISAPTSALDVEPDVQAATSSSTLPDITMGGTDSQDTTHDSHLDRYYPRYGDLYIGRD